MASSSSRRESPFLDDPSDYPEFSLLIKRRRIQHTLRYGLHRHRTAALVALAACSAKLSGAAVPSTDLSGLGAPGLSRLLDEWRVFLTEGLALDLLARHFEGLGSALACMAVMTAVAALVHPLHMLLLAAEPPRVPAERRGRLLLSPSKKPSKPSKWPSSPSQSRRTLMLLSALAVAATAVPVWTLAIWGAGRFYWGAAAGLSVGLLSASLTLKSVSFAQACWASSDESQDKIDRSPADTAKAVMEASPESGESEAEGKDVDLLSLRERKRRGYASASSSAAAAPAAPAVPLELGDFMLFLVTAPTLVCEPRLLRASARRQPRAGRAALEFAHAFLTFVALHAVCSALYAPVMRVLATSVAARFDWFFNTDSGAFCTGGTGGSSGAGDDGNRLSFTELDSSGKDLSTAAAATATAASAMWSAIPWADCAGWAGLKGGVRSAGGSGQWLFSFLPGAGGGESHGVGFVEALCCCGRAGGITGGGWWRTAEASAWGFLVLSPLVHFLAFYGFWHCVCLGLAELTGYPNRDFYGPWWLLTEEPDAMFRLWSTPVHRWLSSCVHGPISKRRRQSSPKHEGLPAVARRLGRRGGGHYDSSAPWSSSTARTRNKDGERCSSTRPNSNAASDGQDNQEKDAGDTWVGQTDSGGGEGEVERERRANAGGAAKKWPLRRVVGIVAAFFVSSVGHEAVTFVAMRWTCWPINTFCLMFAAVVVAGWDVLYPVKSIISDDQEEEEEKERVGTDAVNPGEKHSSPPPLPPPTATTTPSPEPAMMGKVITTASAPAPAAGLASGSGSGSGSVAAPTTEDGPVRGTPLPRKSASGATAAVVSGMAATSVANSGEARGGGVARDHREGIIRGRIGGGGDIGDVVARRRRPKKAGREWRGWGAVAFFQGTSIIMGFIVDLIVWQWWRHTLLLDPSA